MNSLHHSSHLTQHGKGGGRGGGGGDGGGSKATHIPCSSLPQQRPWEMADLAGPAPLPVQWRMSPGQWAPSRHSDVNGFSHIDLEVDWPH